MAIDQTVTETGAETVVEPGGVGSSPTPPGYSSPRIVQTPSLLEVQSALALIASSAVVAFDCETTGLSPLFSKLLLLQLSDGSNTVVFDMTKLDRRCKREIDEYLSEAKQLFIAHNAKFDYGFLTVNLDSETITPRLYDSMLAEQLLGGGAEHGGNSLAAVTKRYLALEMDKAVRAQFIDMEPDPYTGEYLFSREQLDYAAVDVWVLPKIFAKQAHKLTASGLTEIARLEFALAKVVSRMERRGVLIDRVVWEAEVASAKARCAELETQMNAIVGREFNSRSPKQVKEAFEGLGYVLSKTDRGMLEKIPHPLAEAMLEWRRVAVLRDRYGEGWLARADENDRVHAQFVQMGAATGRFSSRDPNLQQLPRGDLLRKAFIAGLGRKMITADYSQIEIRILAEMSNDANMIKIFDSGLDIHAATAQQMFRLDELPDKTSKYRQMAKSVNFGLMYGAGADNLKGQLSASTPRIDVSKAEAEELIKLYFAQFPEAKKWLDAQSRRAYAAMDDGINVVTETLGGRKRVFPTSHAMGSYERGHIARQCRNTPIQGCVDGSTLILTEDLGMRHIEDLVGYVGKVWDGAQYSHASVVASGRKNLLRVTFGGGLSIECSPDHRFKIVSIRGVESFVAAKDLPVSPSNYRVRLTDSVPAWHRYIPPPQSSYTFGHGAGSAGSNRKNLHVSDFDGELTDLGEFLGRIASDGSVSDTQVTLLVAEHEIGLLPSLERVARSFGHVTVRRIDRSREHRQPMTTLTISSVSLAQQLKPLKQGQIPAWVYSDSDLLAGYLRGLFDGDGTVSVDGPSLKLGRGAMKEQFAKQVQIALTMLGIRTSLAVNAYSFGVAVRKSDTPLFARLIGFMNSAKQAKLANVTSDSKRNRFSPSYGRTVTIRSVEDTGLVVPMYDVLNSATDMFMANGVVTHNSSADVTKQAMVLLDQELREHPEWDAHLLMTVHDELVVEAAGEFAAEVAQATEAKMIEGAQVYMKICPVKVDLVIADSWSK